MEFGLYKHHINQLIKSPRMVTKCKNPEQSVSLLYREMQSRWEDVDEAEMEELMQAYFIYLTA